MRSVRVWRALLGVEKTVVEGIEFDEDARVVLARVRPVRAARGRCGVCRRRCPRYDAGRARRRWRGLDLGTVSVLLVADLPRVSCAEHGVVAAHVPWARHGARHTIAFDETVAWLAVHLSKSAVTELMRIAWRTVGAIIARVWAEVQARGDGLDGLRRIGIDEISYKRGRKFLTVVVDHDTGRLVWAAPGRDRATLRAFFDALGPERAAALTHISADAADWVAEVVADRAPGAVQCADAFHVIKWASAALDEVRIAAWRAARAGGAFRRKGRGRRDSTGTARGYRHARYALWKNPDNLTDRQRDKLTWIAKTDPRLHRAYLLKEALRWVFHVKGDTGKQALHRWISWARRCRLPAFIALQRRITRHRREIEATLEHGLSNALIESVNTKIRLITRVAFGFHSAAPLIALAMLSLGGHRPILPSRQ